MRLYNYRRKRNLQPNFGSGFEFAARALANSSRFINVENRDETRQLEAQTKWQF